MYIRATKTHVTKNGAPRYSYRLVRSDRDGNKIRETILLNLGVHFDTPPKQWRELVMYIQSLKEGQAVLAFDPDLHCKAEDIVKRLREKQRTEVNDKSEPQPHDDDDDSVMTVDLNTLKHPEHARQVGGERICVQALEDLGLMDVLREAGVKEYDAILVAGLVVARMLFPASERATHDWLTTTSSTLSLLGWPKEQPPSLTKLYRVNDLVREHDTTVQQALFKAERTLLNLPDTVVFYDLTNTHYFGEARGQYLAYGHSKQKRSDCPLVTLGLVLDSAGFPRTCEVLPGNVSEPSTLKDAIERLEATTGAHKPTVVMDAGIATEANINWLEAAGYQWICVSRGQKYRQPEREADETLKTKANHTVRAWKLQQSATEALVYVVSEAKQHRQTEIVLKRRQKFEEALRTLHEGLTMPYRTKHYEKVVERIGRLKQKHRHVSHHYEVTVTKGPKHNAKAVAFTLKPQREDHDEAIGAYVLRTSHTDWNLQDLIATYWRLSEVESTFRSLKSELGLRPLFHFNDDRIVAHISLSVYAYHAVHLIRTRLKAQGIHYSWGTLRQKMSRWRRVTTTMRDTAGRMIVNIQDEEPDAELKKIAQICGVPADIHRERYVSQTD